jgi:predicted MFS family arabinose efflux permease
VGWAVWSVGLGLFSTLNSPSSGEQIGFGILSGIGIGFTLQPSVIAVQAGVERRYMAIVTSFRNFARNLGGTMGLAISGTIINNAVYTALAPHGLPKSAIQLLINSPDLFSKTYGEQRTNGLRFELSSAYRRGFRVIFILGAVLNALAFVAAWFMIEQLDLKRDDDEQLKQEGKKWDASKRGSARTTG